MPKKRRARCEAVADALDLPRPFDLDVLCERIAVRRGRPLRLLPLEGAPDASLPCGVWIATAQTDLIFYEPATSALHKLQIVLHELAHLLLGHGAPDAERPAYAARLLTGLLDGERGGAVYGTTEAGAARRGLADDPAADVDDELDLDQLLHILGRTSYSDEQEKDAEFLATLLSERALDGETNLLSERALADEADARSHQAHDVLDRLNDAFGHPVRRNP